jgi:hypothetical protein
MLRLELSPIALIALASCTLVFQDADEGNEAQGADADIASPQNMLSEHVSIIKKSGGDFSSLLSWKSERGGDLRARQLLRVSTNDTIGDDESLVTSSGECSGTLKRMRKSTPITEAGLMSLDLDGAPCEAGDVLTIGDATIEVLEAGPKGISETLRFEDLTITAPLVVDGVVADAEHFLTLQAAPGTKHHRETTPGPDEHAMEIRVDYTHVVGFEFTQWAIGTSDNDSIEAIHVSANYVVLDRLLFHEDGGGQWSGADAIFTGKTGVNLTVRNSIFYKLSRAGVMAQDLRNGKINIHNCTFVDCVRDDQYPNDNGCVTLLRVDNSQLEIINTLAISDQSYFMMQSETSTFGGSSNNASSDALAPGPASIHNISRSELQQISMAPYDLHLSAASTLKEMGSPLGSFDHDYEGTLRSEPWSIGAYQASP